MSGRISVGLVHYPIVDKAGKIVATNVTNLDVHDIARACRVYGIQNYFVINTMKEQLMFVSRILDFWRTGTGSDYNHMRRTALTMVKTAETVADAARQLGDPEIIATSARAPELSERLKKPIVTFKSLREELSQSSGRDILLLFGTGFGMADEVFIQSDRILEPLKGQAPLDYRHLSVRSAVSICLDRLIATW